MLLGGWASNNKYALLGGMRAAAQMISYEIPLVMSVLGVILLTGSLNLNDIVAAQENGLVYCSAANCLYRLFYRIDCRIKPDPFDLPESENELVAGYHVEYSGFRWAFFMLTEYVYMFAMSALITVVFLGGWFRRWTFLGFIPGAVWFALKFSVVVFVLLWMRGTFPRFRVDKLWNLAGKCCYQ